VGARARTPPTWMAKMEQGQPTILASAILLARQQAEFLIAPAIEPAEWKQRRGHGAMSCSFRRTHCHLGPKFRRDAGEAKAGEGSGLVGSDGGPTRNCRLAGRAMLRPPKTAGRWRGQKRRSDHPRGAPTIEADLDPLALTFAKPFVPQTVFCDWRGGTKPPASDVVLLSPGRFDWADPAGGQRLKARGNSGCASSHVCGTMWRPAAARRFIRDFLDAAVPRDFGRCFASAGAFCKNEETPAGMPPLRQTNWVGKNPRTSSPRIAHNK